MRSIQIVSHIEGDSSEVPVVELGVFPDVIIQASSVHHTTHTTCHMTK